MEKPLDPKGYMEKYLKPLDFQPKNLVKAIEKLLEIALKEQHNWSYSEGYDKGFDGGFGIGYSEGLDTDMKTFEISCF
jgi:hypothetical protein